MRHAYRLLFARDAVLSEQVERVAAEFAGQPLVEEVVAFIRDGGRRRTLTPWSGTGSALQGDEAA